MKKISTSQIVISFFLACFTIYPLIILLRNINFDDVTTLVNSPQFYSMLTNSLLIALISTVISVSLALLFAWCIQRTNIKHKNLLNLLFTVPMLIPTISHGMGLALLWGDNGVLTNLLGINIHIYGFNGMIIGFVLYSFPIAFLLISDIFQYEDYTLYEAAEVLGLSKIQQFLKITMQNLKRPIVSAFFAVFTMVFTDYGIPLAIGGKVLTLSSYMYREVIGLLNFSTGAFLGSVLLIPAFIAFLCDLKLKERISNTISKPYMVRVNKNRDFIASFLSVLMTLFILLPVLAFILLSVVKQYPLNLSLSFKHFETAFNLGVGKYCINSITIALLTALIGSAIIYYAAFITSKSKKTLPIAMLHLISMLSLAIPGIVLGLSYTLAFKSSPIYGGLIILVLVNIIHFFSSPYLMAYNSLNQLNVNLEDVRTVLGISKLSMVIDVYIPNTQETIIEMFAYLFVNAMVTISAVSFLANYKVMPVALLIPQFDAQSMIEVTSIISLIILCSNGILKLLIYFVKKYMSK